MGGTLSNMRIKYGKTVIKKLYISLKLERKLNLLDHGGESIQFLVS